MHNLRISQKEGAMEVLPMTALQVVVHDLGL